jgi:hypothetical protein
MLVHVGLITTVLQRGKHYYFQRNCLMFKALLSFEVFMKPDAGVFVSLCMLRVCDSFNVNQHTTLF